MLGYDLYLLSLVFPLLLGGIYFWGSVILFDGSSIAFHEDCCCCVCSYCSDSPPESGVITFSGVQKVVQSTHPIVYVCDECDDFNTESFSLDCDEPPAACTYSDNMEPWDHCTIDQIRFNYHYTYGGYGDGVAVTVEDSNHLSNGAFFWDVRSYNMTCDATQASIPLRDDTHDECDWENATATWTPD